jgi:hypothetical protein
VEVDELEDNSLGAVVLGRAKCDWQHDLADWIGFAAKNDPMEHALG